MIIFGAIYLTITLSKPDKGKENRPVFSNPEINEYRDGIHSNSHITMNIKSFTMNGYMIVL